VKRRGAFVGVSASTRQPNPIWLASESQTKPKDRKSAKRSCHRCKGAPAQAIPNLTSLCKLL
jgi:hypothetical protein